MIQNLTGLILRKRDFMEKDLALTVLSSTGERLELIVKGAGGKSKRRGHLELMNLIQGTLYKTKSHLYLQSVECQSSFSLLKNKLDEVLRMHLLLEILEKTVPAGSAEPKIYRLALSTLQAANTPEPCPFLLEATLIQLAHLLGFLPSFKHCGSCHAELNEEALWDMQGGTVHCLDCQKIASTQGSHTPARSPSTLPLKYRKAFEFFRLASPTEASKLRLAPDEHKNLQEWIPALFHWHLDRPLKSLATAFR